MFRVAPAFSAYLGVIKNVTLLTDHSSSLTSDDFPTIALLISVFTVNNHAKKVVLFSATT